jgi:SM-20-related protein
MAGEQTPSIFVVGPEGSGTTLLWRCIIAHPELQGMTRLYAPPEDVSIPSNVILHLSLPTLRPMRWVVPEDLPAGSKVILLRRSPVHTVYSAYRRFYRNPAAAWRSYFRAVELEGRYIESHDPLCLNYEDLVCHTARVLRSVYQFLGVSSDFQPPVQLANKNDNRWRQDAGFRRFMQSTFGSLAPSDSGSLEGAEATVYPAPEMIVPARYVRIENLLEPEEHARLLSYVLAHEADFAASRVTSAGKTAHVNPEFRRSGTVFDLSAIWDLFKSRLTRLLPHVRRELGTGWFPLGQIERQLSVHQDEDFFGVHADDRNDAVADRRITCLYYFHGQPKRFSGGELRIYDSEVRGGRLERTNTYVDVEPRNNSAVFFPSGFYHEVRPVHRETPLFADSRFSISVWFWLGPVPPCLADGRQERSA